MRSVKSAVILGAAASSIACALALSGCSAVAGGTRSGGGGSSGGGNNGTGTSQSITGDWKLVSGSDASGAITPSGGNVTLNINGQGSGGSGGCNAFGAVATGSTTGPFSIRLGIHTDMACVGAERDITEQHYFAALGKVDRASMTGAELTLSGPGVSLTFDRTSS